MKDNVMTNVILRGATVLGNLHIWFEEGKIVSTKPSVGVPLRYKKVMRHLMSILAIGFFSLTSWLSMPAWADPAALLWRPQSADDNWTSAAWRNADDPADETVYSFLSGAKAIFDGAESIPLSSISVPENVSVGDVLLGGGLDYTLSGNGKLMGSGTVVKDGLGKLTVDGAGFDQQEIIVRAGTLKVGDNAGGSALGGSGALRVEAGASLDINHIITKSDVVDPRGAITFVKEIYLAGVGVNGAGALYDLNTTGYYCTALGRVYLTDDATISGLSRIDFRDRSSVYSWKPCIYGPGKTLTVDFNRQLGAGNARLNLFSTDVTLKKIVLAPGSCMTYEKNPVMRVDEGIEARDNAQVCYYDSNSAGKTPINIVGTNVRIMQQLEIDNIQDEAITIQKGASAVLSTWEDSSRNTGTLVCSGVLTNKGSVVVERGRHRLAGGIVNEGDIEVKGGVLDVASTAFANTGSVKISGGKMRFAPGAYGDVAFAQSGGVVGFGSMTLSGAFPTFTSLVIEGHSREISLETAEPQTVTGSSCQFDDASLTVNMLGKHADQAKDVAAITVQNANWNLKALNVGNSEGSGNLILDGGKVTTTALSTGNAEDASGYSGRMELRNGAEVLVSGSNPLRIGVSGVNAANFNELVLGDGSRLTASQARLYVGADALRARCIMEEGAEIDVRGLTVRQRYTKLENKRPETYFRMDGGTLKLGDYALSHGYHKCTGTSDGNELLKTHIEELNPFFRFNGGRIVATANTETDRSTFTSWGLDAVFGENRNGGSVKIDTDRFAFNLRTGLKGFADVVVSGTGSFNTYAHTKGAPQGHWTIGTGKADLSGAFGFPGGLTLGEGCEATVSLGATNLVNCIVNGNTASGTLAAGAVRSFYDSELYFVHHSAFAQSYHGFAYSGQFYVPEAKTWYFAGRWDDGITLQIDGKHVVSGSWSTPTEGNVALTVGWHEFFVAMEDGHGGQGTGVTGWTDMGLGYRIGSSGGNGSSSANYTRFDTDTVLMRPTAKTFLWMHKKYATRTALRDYAFMELPEHAYDSVTYTDKCDLFMNGSSAGDGQWASSYLAQSQNMLKGSFFVTEAQAGSWKVGQAFDDYMALAIDGKWVVSNNTYTTTSTGFCQVTSGWHEFEIVWGDTFGGYGPTGSFVKNGVRYPLVVTINGASDWVPFHPDFFVFGEAPLSIGLPSDTELKAGSTLRNVAATACPISGTLFGSGSLAGAFAFTSEGVLRVVSGAGRDSVSCVDLAQVTNNDCLKNLTHVELVLTAKASYRSVALCDAKGLTSADLSKISLSVKAVEGAGTVVTEGWTLGLRDGKLELVNPCPDGLIIIVE